MKKYAWYSSEDNTGSYDDGYHKDVGSFSKAFSESSKALIDKWKLNPKDVEFVGAPPFGVEAEWADKVLTKEDIEKFIVKQGFCQFKLQYKNDKDKYIQGWSSVSTMDYLNKEQEELKQQYQEIVQEEADRTGKKTSVVCMAGWNFDAEPKKSKKGKKSK